jgi:hypothetical protein
MSCGGVELSREPNSNPRLLDDATRNARRRPANTFSGYAPLTSIVRTPAAISDVTCAIGLPDAGRFNQVKPDSVQVVATRWTVTVGPPAARTLSRN